MRRNDLSKMDASEISIVNSMQAVEKLGADARLTVAIDLLSKAKELVSDYLDAKEVESKNG